MYACGQVKKALKEQLPTIFVALQSLTATLGAAWLISCKKLGGLLCALICRTPSV